MEIKIPKVDHTWHTGLLGERAGGIYICQKYITEGYELAFCYPLVNPWDLSKQKLRKTKKDWCAFNDKELFSKLLKFGYIGPISYISRSMRTDQLVEYIIDMYRLANLSRSQ